MWLKQGQIEVDGEDGHDYDEDDHGDNHAKGTSPSLHPLPNQSKPIVNSFSYLILLSHSPISL